MPHPRRPAPSLLVPYAALLISACGGQPAPSAPAPSAPAPAAQPSAPIADYVVEVFADSKGVLWFGTMGKGVARHDGEKLTYLSPAGGKGENVVASIAEDSHGNLWFAGHDGTGVCKYDGTTFTQIWEEESHVSTDRQGNIWVGTRRGVFRNDHDGLTRFDVPLGDATAYTITPGRIAMELADSRGNLWFRADGHGVFRHDGSSFTRFTKQDGLCSNTVWSIVEDRQGRLWFGCVQAFQPTTTGDGGLVRFDGTTFTAFPEVKGLANNDIYTLHADRSGNLWIGATGVGVIRYTDDAFTLFDATDRPDLNGGFGLQAMTEDQRGTLWFGFSGGLFRFADAGFVHVAQDGPWR